jgi:hypothetical protein
MTVLSAVCTGLWGYLSNYWPAVVGTFVLGSWFGIFIMGLLIDASRRCPPAVEAATCQKCKARLAKMEGRP